MVSGNSFGPDRVGDESKAVTTWGAIDEQSIYVDVDSPGARQSRQHVRITHTRAVVNRVVEQGLECQADRGTRGGSAEQTFPNFYRESIAAGFKFNTFTERGVERFAQAGPDELVRRLRARTTTTNRPPVPTIAMLGEIVVPGDDIRRPLGLVHRSPDAALVAVANSWKNSNLLIGAKRRIAGLTLTSTDVPWSHGGGPEVRGPLQSLVLAMTGRQGSHQDLDGDGLEILALRN
jgi:hypothetical protein